MQMEYIIDSVSITDCHASLTLSLLSYCWNMILLAVTRSILSIARVQLCRYYNEIENETYENWQLYSHLIEMH